MLLGIVPLFLIRFAHKNAGRGSPAQRVPGSAVRFPVPATNGNDPETIVSGSADLCGHREVRNLQFQYTFWIFCSLGAPKYLKRSSIRVTLCIRKATPCARSRKPPPKGDFLCAGTGNRTLIFCLEGRHFTTKLCPRWGHFSTYSCLILAAFVILCTNARFH